MILINEVILRLEIVVVPSLMMWIVIFFFKKTRSRLAKMFILIDI